LLAKVESEWVYNTTNLRKQLNEVKPTNKIRISR